VSVLRATIPEEAAAECLAPTRSWKVTALAGERTP